MVEDLREFLHFLDEHGELVRVKKEIDTRLEITNLIWTLEKKNKFPALFFENVKDSQMPIVCNLLADRKKIAMVLDTTGRRASLEFAMKLSQGVPPKLMDDGPVKEKILKGDEVDLRRFPIVTCHEKDAAPYITAGLVITKDPDTSVRNVAVHRFMVKEKDRCGTHLAPGHHLTMCHRKAEERGEPLEVAVVLGVHPALYLASQAPVPYGVDELEIAGNILNKRLEVVKCETIDLEVPAYSEIVLEGIILPNIRESEGPFGEFTGYYSKRVDREVFKIKAITHRKNPLYQHIAVGYAEHLLMGGVAKEALIFNAVKGVVPTVRAVHLPVSGTSRFHCYISIDKTYETDAKTAILAALSSDFFIKHVVVVDNDIDIFDERQVLWAVATRMQADRDVLIMPAMKGSDLDPSSSTEATGYMEDGMQAKMGIDATKPLSTPFPAKLRANQIVLDDYLT